METLNDHLGGITPTSSGGFELTAAARQFIEPYLKKQGFTLVSLTTSEELISCLRHCNAVELERTLSQASPNGFQFLWKRLRTKILG